MRQVNIKELHSATREKLLGWLPCQIIYDGRVIAQIVPLAAGRPAIFTDRSVDRPNIDIPENEPTFAESWKRRYGDDDAV
jgi:hypothetical protein